MKDLAQQVRKTIRRHRMMHAGDRVGVAVSGGADSVALLRLLLEWRAEFGVTLLVLHFNHLLRGAESDADERFVASLAERHALEFLAAREDVAAAAARKKANLEEAARQFRYRFFSGMVDSGRVTRVATGHTADDQAETVLAHLLRGTGITGLAGIYPVVGTVVRPLLDVRRSALRDYLAARGQTWREDITNLDTARLRARVRQTLLPALERDFQPAVVEHLASLAHLARGDEEAWQALLDILYPATVEKTPAGLRIAISRLSSPFATLRREAGLAPEALQRRLVRRALEDLTGHRRRFTAHHVERVLRLGSQSAGGCLLQLPGGVRVRRTLDGHLDFSMESKETQSPPAPYEYVVGLAVPQTLRVDVAALGKRFFLKVIDWPQAASETKDGVEALDLDLLSAPVVFRNWRPGDAYRPRGHQRAHKLKRLFWELSIESRERPHWPVLTSAGRVVWARGLPPAEEFAARPGTRAALLIDEEEW